jgi:transcriptional regulator GlxA family with amidase domain
VRDRAVPESALHSRRKEAVMSKTVGILLFPEVEELDFAGPLEVFGVLAQYFDRDWQVVTIAQSREPFKGANGLTVGADHTFDDSPPLDVLLVPGGAGTRREVDNEKLIEFVRRAGSACQWVTSVCTGAFILSRAGFLDGREATTHWASLGHLRAEPGIRVVEERFVQDGNVISAAGVSAGIDMALYLVGLLKSPEVARRVQKAIEYYPEPPFGDGAIATPGREAE